MSEPVVASSEPVKVPISSVFDGRPWLLPTLTGVVGFIVGLVVFGSGLALVGLVQSADAPEPTVFSDALEECKLRESESASIDDGGFTLTVESRGDEDSSGLGYEAIACILDALEAPTAVISHFEQTTAMDGRQTESWDSLTLSWSYHPDRGADYIVTLDKPKR